MVQKWLDYASMATTTIYVQAVAATSVYSLRAGGQLSRKGCSSKGQNRKQHNSMKLGDRHRAATHSSLRGTYALDSRGQSESTQMHTQQSASYVLPK